MFGKGLILGKRIKRILHRALKTAKYQNIEDFDTKFVATACDILSGEQVVINSGNILDAIMASISIPGAFRPVEKDGMLLVDGGVIDNMPIKQARDLGTDIVLGIDVQSVYKNDGHNSNWFSLGINGLNRLLVSLANLKQDRGDMCIDIEQLEGCNLHRFNKDLTKRLIEYGRQCTIEALPEIKRLLEQ